ncbi:MAG: RHS repeat protein [Phycisphaerae bacterium]|nr:RHS repeat protein [Phycisphaerae bacterium]
MHSITGHHGERTSQSRHGLLACLAVLAFLGGVSFAWAGGQPDPCELDMCAPGCPYAGDPCCESGDDDQCETDDPNNDPIGPGGDYGWLPWPGDDIVYLPPCPPYGPFGGGSNPFLPPDSVGDALHVQFTTGNVWTRVPIVENASEASASSFVIRYDSQRADIEGPLGYGWSHAYDSFIVDTDPNQVVLHEGDGTRTAFTVSGPLFVPPPGCDLKLTIVGGLYQVTTSYGAVLSFNSSKRLSQITERSGLTSRIQYDGQGRVNGIINPFGRKITITYNGNGQIYQVTGPDSATTTFGYAQGHLTSITDPQSHAVYYDYDANDQLVSETLRNGVTYTVDYDYAPQPGWEGRSIEVIDGASSHVVGRIASAHGFPAGRSSPIEPGYVYHTDGRGNNWTIMRDHLGRIWMVEASNGKRQWTIWGGPTDGNARGRVLSIENERNKTRSFTYDAYGNVASVTDEEGYETLYAHENASFRSLVTERTDPGGNVWEYQYDGAGRLTTVVDPITDDGPGVLDAQITYSYQSFFGDMEDIGTLGLALPGRVKILHKTDRDGKTTRFEYNGRGDLVKVTRDYSVLNLVTEFEYDDAGRMTARVVHRGPSDTTRTEYDYDTRGWLETVEADPTGLDLTTSFTYDDHGNVDTVTNPRGYVTKYEYDYRNRLTATIEAYGEPSFGLRTEYEYDGNGNVTAVNDPRHTVEDPHRATFAYNGQDFLTSITDAEGYLTELTVDGVGNVIRRDRHLTTTPGSKHSVSMQYDGLSRLRVIVEDPDTLALTTQIDYEAPGGCGCGATLDADNPYRIIDPAGKISYCKYDKLDRLTQVIRKVGDTSIDPDGDDVVFTSEYDAHGNVTAFVGPEGERTEYEYDGAHRRTKTRVIDPSVAAQHLVTEFGYDGANNVTQIDFPNGNTGILVYD